MSDDESNDETGDLSYAIQVTDGELVPSIGPVSLLIDMIGRADDADVGGRRPATWSPARKAISPRKHPLDEYRRRVIPEVGRTPARYRSQRRSQSCRS